MSKVTQKVRHLPMRLAFGIAVLLLTVWGALALWHQMPQHSAARWIATLAWSASGLSVAVSLAGLLERRTRRIAGFVFGAATAALLMWWGTLQPSHQRAWADDVAQLLEAGICLLYTSPSPRD